MAVLASARPEPAGRPVHVLRFPLVGAGGEPVDLWRTFVSHGVASLPPMRVDEASRSFEVTLRVEGARPRTVVVSSSDGYAVARVVGRYPGVRIGETILASVRHVLRFDEDLSAFYSIAASDPDLSWATAGAGRMIRSQTVFEDVVKTLCTTNCSWSATERMVGALVQHLGEKATGAPDAGVSGRAFPTPEAMAEADEAFYRTVVRAGYRGAYLRGLSRSVATGEVNLEALVDTGHRELSDDEVAVRLQALPGIGPYAAAHIMLMLGRYSRLILDSWTRPKYARLAGVQTVTDAEIEKRFESYGRYAGLAFWLYLTRDWVTEPQMEARPPDDS